MQSNTSDLHKHHYFELIYIMEGEGIHNINGNHYDFKKGEAFLLTPEDAHTFIISSPVKSCIIDFTQNFFSAKGKGDLIDSDGELFKRLEYIFHNHNKIKGNLLQGNDADFIEKLIEQLLNEKENPSLIGESIIKNIVFLLLQFVTRNIQVQNTLNRAYGSSGRAYDIINYIQQFIYDKESLRLEVMAGYFKTSPDHLTRIFKSDIGKTIKEYVIDYKIELIKTRLKFSTLSVSEIAYELNFTDESHLNKLFKNKFGVSVAEFKKSLKI
ncbi:helix-turn-helix domain-containing protein [Flavobacterium sp. FlaQc-30]|uniref:AraC family transcriptional regulator n=1 Tax=Flavobacterium sp. FlaQc-30 TaxID=3374179 RepID=UPI00375833B1